MQINYRNKRLERILIVINGLAAAMVAANFVLLFGFEKPLFAAKLLFLIQAILLAVFISEKIFRIYNSSSVREYLRGNWYELPLLAAFVITAFGANIWFDASDSVGLRHLSIGLYLVIQVVIKVCRTVINLAASGRNPTKTLILSFLVLIITGAGLLMLPKSTNGKNISVIDSLFTATSATCVTGLTVKDTGSDFSMMGQIIILSLIQLGGLGIVVFGAVFALLLGQALSLRESVAMQDLLSTQTLNRIGNIIAFIFVGTFFFEALGAICLFGMWSNQGASMGIQQQWFYSIFHSISAFCNAGFSLFKESLINYSTRWGVYLVIMPLIIIGGLGFGVLYNIFNVGTDRIERFFKKLFFKQYRFSMETPKRLSLQTKIVCSVSLMLIIIGTVLFMLFEKFARVNGTVGNGDVLAALFQSVSARTAGFNTIDVSQLSPSSRIVLMLLMFVGGSPGSTAGGIKTVTLAVVLMTVIATLRKRSEVEMFGRAVKLIVVARAITVTILFVLVLFTAALLLSITEANNGMAMADIFFEASSALGTVGLSTGITSSLTNAGKLIIIILMLIGRLGPLTLLAASTFNLKPGKYNYPEEAIIVG